MKYIIIILTLVIFITIALYFYEQSPETRSVGDIIQEIFQPAPMPQSKKIALVIGNKQYEYMPLAVNNAIDMAERLRQSGFDVILGTNLNQAQMLKLISQFAQRLSEDVLGLFYFSGYGSHAGDENYLLPVENNKILDEESLQSYAIAMSSILRGMRKASLNIVILDAHHNNPFRGATNNQGLKRMESSKNTIISYVAQANCQPSSMATCERYLKADRLSGSQATAFACYKKVLEKDETNVQALVGLEKIEARYLELAQNALKSREILQAQQYIAGLRAVNPGAFQLAQLEGNLSALEVRQPEKPSIQPEKISIEAEMSHLVAVCKQHLVANNEETALACYQEILEKEPNNLEAQAGIAKVEAHYVTLVSEALDGEKTSQAKQYLERLRLINPDSAQLVLLEERLSSKGFRDRLKEGGWGPEMVWIPAGSFQMGDIQGEGEEDEKPVHRLSISQFAIGKYEITFKEYDQFAEATGREKPNDEGWGRALRPVINVSMHDASAYVQWLSEQTGKEYRLPTEAQWEYAARAGTSTKYWWGNEIGINNAVCNGCGDAKKMTAPVGSFAANPFGLFDTVGNVWEWTCSKYENKYSGEEMLCTNDASSYVQRGGSWDDEADGLRAAVRNEWQPSERDIFDGFRIVRIP